jgi:hypothetical protein
MLASETGSRQLASVRTLLAGAIDYAGLFPPAGLSMPEAVINYATYRNSNFSWMLGRFVVPAGRLNEFQESASEFVSRDAGSAWPVSVIASENLHDTVRLVEDFNATNGPGLICDALEIKAESPGLIENAAKSLPPKITAYFELELDDSLADQIAALALNRQRAKIRTGGIIPEAFPATPDIIRFVRSCLAADVPFKATAGLHHPIRCFRALTYESDSPSGTMHGFLNLFLMTGFALEGYRLSLLQDVMEEEFEEVFRFDEQSASWRDDFSLNIWQLEALRKKGIQSFGSCSFDEPVAELQAMGIL